MSKALEIAEAIINEVSIRRWKEAAANVLPKRGEEAEAAKASAEKGWEEYDKAARKHPEEEPALYKLAQANDEAAQKTEDKADHAYAVTRLRTNDKANANKAIKAARKVQDKREDEFGRNPEKRTLLRSGKANQLVSADPVKSRADEALELAEAIINEGDNLARNIIDYAKRHKMSGKKRNRLVTKAERVPSYNDFYVDSRDKVKVSGDPSKHMAKRDCGDYDHVVKQELDRNDRYGIRANQAFDRDQGYSRAIKKSIERHNKKINEMLELAEAIVAAASPDDDYYNQKSIRRNAEKEAKKHGYNAKQYEKRSIKAEEAGRERRAEYLYDKANSEWDKETAQQQRAADAHRKVEDMRFRRRGKGMDEALELIESIHDAIEKYIKDPKKKEDLHNRAFDNRVQDDINQMNRIEKTLKGVKPSSLEASELAYDIKRSQDENKISKNIKGAAKTDARSGILRANPNVDIDKDEFREQEKEYRRNRLNKNEALQLAEAIVNAISEGDNLRDVVKRARRAGKIDNAKGSDLEKRAMRVPADNDYYQDEEGNNVYRLHGKGVSKTALGAYLNDQRHYDKGRDEEELWNKRRNDEVRGYPQATAKGIKKHNKTNEALQLAEAICDFADNLFELDYEQKQDISPNKIKKTKKDKNGEKVDVVSVADELFPYEGNAKQQYNKKILGKINDMIEGTGSLEDLIQFVRAGAKVKKVANEDLNESKPKDPEGYRKNIEIANHYDKLFSKEPANSPDGSPNSVASTWNEKYQEYLNKAMKCYYGDGSKKEAVKEALEIAEAIINEVTKKFIGPKLEKGKEISDEIKRETDLILKDPTKTEEEKEEAVKRNAEYQCKAVNTTNKATDYLIDKSKK